MYIEIYIYIYILRIIIPTDELIYFSEGRSTNHQPDNLIDDFPYIFFIGKSSVRPKLLTVNPQGFSLSAAKFASMLCNLGAFFVCGHWSWLEINGMIQCPYKHDQLQLAEAI